MNTNFNLSQKLDAVHALGDRSNGRWPTRRPRHGNTWCRRVAGSGDAVRELASETKSLGDQKSSGNRNPWSNFTSWIWIFSETLIDRTVLKRIAREVPLHHDPHGIPASTGAVGFVLPATVLASGLSLKGTPL